MSQGIEAEIDNNIHITINPLGNFVVIRLSSGRLPFYEVFVDRPNLVERLFRITLAHKVERARRKLKRKAMRDWQTNRRMYRELKGKPMEEGK